MDVLSSRILLRPGDLDRSRCFYRDLLGLAVYREFGPPDDPGLVFFLGQGLLEVSGRAAGRPGSSVMIWIQVRDVHAEHARLAAAGVLIVREPTAEPWGLIEMWIEDPDGIRIVLVEVPAGHPLRRDPRSALPPALAAAEADKAAFPRKRDGGSEWPARGQPGTGSLVRPVARTRSSRTANRVPAMRGPRGRAPGRAPPGPRAPRNGRPRCGGLGSRRAAGRCRRSR